MPDQMQPIYRQWLKVMALISFSMERKHGPFRKILLNLCFSIAIILPHRITSAHEARAAVIFARTNRNDAQRGITAFLVDMEAPGVRLSPKEEKLGIRATSTSDIILDGVRVPRNNVLGEIGDGFKIAMNQMQLGRVGVASQALGIAQAALDLAVQYACERKTFGYPLIDKQLVKVKHRHYRSRIRFSLTVFRIDFFQSKIAKMAIDLESARLLSEFRLKSYFCTNRISILYSFLREHTISFRSVEGGVSPR